MGINYALVRVGDVFDLPDPRACDYLQSTLRYWGFTVVREKQAHDVFRNVVTGRMPYPTDAVWRGLARRARVLAPGGFFHFENPGDLRDLEAFMRHLRWAEYPKRYEVRSRVGRLRLTRREVDADPASD